MRRFLFATLPLALGVPLLSGCGALLGLEDSYENDPPASSGGNGGAGAGAAGAAQGGAGAGSGGAGASAGKGGKGGAGAGGDAGQGGDAGDGGTGGDGGAGQAGAGGAGQAGAGQAGAGQGGAGEGGAGGGAGAGAGGAGAGGQPGCNEGEYSCLVDLLRQCDAQGQYQIKETCGAGLCNAAAAKCNACMPGSLSCSGVGKRLICDAAGNGQTEEACPADAPLCDDGTCVSCKVDADCKPSDDPCRRATCLKGACEQVLLKPSDPVPDPTPGDCFRMACDLQGALQMLPDPSDTFDDQNPCTKDVCINNFPSVEYVDVGTPCGDGLICTSQGLCSECNPGTAQCVGNSSEICGGDGKWVFFETCKNGNSCVDGSCICVTQTVCGPKNEICVDLDNDPNNCGNCDLFCAPDQVCQKGLCACPVSECNGQCIDTKTDANNCGSCGNACPADKICQGGQCACPVAQCGGACVDTQSDHENCGACNAPCAPKELCTGGACQCTGTVCGGACKDTDTDPKNCGACGVACPVACSAGKCVTVDDVAVGSSQSFAAPVCAIFSDKTMRCILDKDLKVGFPTPAASVGHTPWNVDGLSKVKSLAIGIDFTCAILDTGKVACSGANDYGQLGDGTTNSRVGFSLAQMPGGSSAIAAGYANTEVIIGGEGWFFGYNPGNYFGVGNPNPLFKQVTPGKSLSLPTDATFVALQGSTTSANLCGRSSQQGLYCWGDNQFGLLGRGASPPNPGVPGPLALTGVVDIALRAYHACAVADGASGTKDVYCWGYNNSGQAGADVDLSPSISTPVRVLSNVGASVAVGAGHSCALMLDGQVACWGANARGELGYGTAEPSKIPRVVPKLSGVKKLAAGGLTTCAVTNDGKLYCWGFIDADNIYNNSPKTIFFPNIY